MFSFYTRDERNYSWQHQQPHKQAKQQVELTSKKNKQLFTDATNRHGHCKVRRHAFINKVVRKAINFWCTNITITITTTIMSIFCWKGNWRESWQGQTTSGKPQHDLSFQNSSPLHSSLKQLQQLYNNTFSTFFSSRFMESRRARSFMTQLYPPFLALTSKSGVFWDLLLTWEKRWFSLHYCCHYWSYCWLEKRRWLLHYWEADQQKLTAEQDAVVVALNQDI